MADAAARRMGKSELFSHFAERFQIKRTEAREIFDELNALAEKELKRAGEFVLPGMCKLVVQNRKARLGRKPRDRRDDRDSREDCREGTNREAVEGRGSPGEVTPGDRRSHGAAERASARMSSRPILCLRVLSGMSR